MEIHKESAPVVGQIQRKPELSDLVALHNTLEALTERLESLETSVERAQRPAHMPQWTDQGIRRNR